MTPRASKNAEPEAPSEGRCSGRLRLDKIPRFETLQRFAEEYPELDPAAMEASLTLWCIGGELSFALETHFRRYDLSPGRFMVLMALLRHGTPGLTPAELADRSQVTRATMTCLLDGLEGAELVVREPNPDDRRSLQVTLTRKGRRALDRILPDHYRRIAALMGALSTDEKRTLTRLLQKVAEGLPRLQDP